MLDRMVFILLSACLFLSCGNGHGEVRPELKTLLEGAESPNPYDFHDTAPDGGCTPLRSKNIGPLFAAFKDLPEAHMPHAKAAGIKPIVNDDSAWHNATHLVRIRSDKNLFIDTLHHSYPYLRCHAADLLHEIGQRFSDSLQARGGGDYRLKVTSMLRTPHTVKALRRVNRNASGESAHSYATTFDISYSKFICDNPSGTRRTFEDLKNLLAEIVYDLREEGRCMVKIERKQACMHITATKPDPDRYLYVPK